MVQNVFACHCEAPKFWHHAANLWYHVVCHLNLVTLSGSVKQFIHSVYHFSILYQQATVHSVVHSYTVHSKNYLSLYSTASETMFFLISHLFRKLDSITGLIYYFPVMSELPNCSRNVFFSCRESCFHFCSPPKCHTHTKMKPRNKTVTLPMNNSKL
jgi:hypothetical protein